MKLTAERIERALREHRFIYLTKPTDARHIISPVRDYADPVPRGESMTIAIGVCAKDGIVLCADRLISIGDAAKGYEKKILTFDSGDHDFCMAIAHAGGNDVAKLVKGTILATLLDDFLMKMDTPNANDASQAITQALRSARKSHPSEVGKLQLLFAFGRSDLGAFHLFKSTGGLVREIERGEPMEIRGTLTALTAWLLTEAEARTNSAESRRDTAATMRGATAEELRAAKKTAEQMHGRKLPRVSATVESAQKSAEIDERIAAKLENEARQLLAWADCLRKIAAAQEEEK